MFIKIGEKSQNHTAVFMEHTCCLIQMCKQFGMDM